MASKKINSSERYMLKGSLKKNGFDRWRIVTTGFSTVTGEERTFFIEFFAVNPLISPNECILGFKSRMPKSEADLQHALAGTQAAMSSNKETFVQPSFFMVKAGVLGAGGKHINAYYSADNVDFSKT